MATGVRLLLVAIVTLVVAATITSAAGTGALKVDGSLAVTDAEVTLTDAAFHSRASSAARPDILVSAGRVTATYVWATHQEIQNPIGQPIWTSPELDSAQFSGENLAITLTDVASDAEVLIWSPAFGANTALRFASAEIAAVTRATLIKFDAFGEGDDAANANWGEGGSSDRWFTFAVENVHAARGDNAVFEFDGDFNVYVRGATVHVGDQVFETKRTMATTATGLDEERRAYLVLRLAESEGVLTAAPDATLYANPTVVARHVAGVATGSFYDDARRIDIARDFILDGEIVLAFDPPNPTPASFTVRNEFEADPPQTIYAPAMTARLGGSVTATSETSIPIAQPILATSSATATLVGSLTLLGALAYFWPLLKFHATVLLIPLYTRLREPEILDNEVRESIYAIITRNPGLSARAIHRESDHSWGTVVYHLRQLERHHLVTSRRLGRSRNFYENHGKYKGMEVELAALRSDKSALLARVIASDPGITQEGLTARAGLPQSTVSYYVRKLKEAELIEERRVGKYAAYYPARDIEGLLTLVATR